MYSDNSRLKTINVKYKTKISLKRRDICGYTRGNLKSVEAAV